MNNNNNNNNNSVSDNYPCNVISKQKLVINFPYPHKTCVYLNIGLEQRVTKKALGSFRNISIPRPFNNDVPSVALLAISCKPLLPYK